MSEWEFMRAFSLSLAALIAAIGLVIFFASGGWRSNPQGWGARRLASLNIPSVLYLLGLAMVFGRPNLGKPVLAAIAIALTALWYASLVTLAKSRWFEPPEPMQAEMALKAAASNRQLRREFHWLTAGAAVAGIVVSSPLLWLVAMRLSALLGIESDMPVRSHPNGGWFLCSLFFAIVVWAGIAIGIGMALLAVGCALAGRLSWSEARTLGRRWEMPDRWYQS